MFSFIDAAICVAYGHYGRFIGLYPWPFILVPLVISVFTPLGLANRNVIRDVPYLYTPTDSRYYEEQNIIKEHWPNLDGTFAPNKALSQYRQCQVILSPLNASESILDEPYGDDVDYFNQYIMREIYVFHEGERYTFNDICYHMYDGNCWDNVPVVYAIAMHHNDPSRLTYPAYYIGNAKIYIASLLGGVTLRERDGNLTNEVYSAKTWLLIFQLRYETAELDYISEMWENEFADAMKTMVHPSLRIQYFNSQSPFNEISRSGYLAISKFAITFAVLLIFTMLCGVGFSIDGHFLVDWCRTKSMLGLYACITSGMGCVFTIAFFAACKAPWNPILALMPFLIIAIGVDNLFLLLAAWKRTDINEPTHIRMGRTLSTAAISITITALTDALCFAVACMTTIPAVEQFCMYTALAVAITFVFQMTFLLGVMTLYGRLEEHGRHHFFFYKVTPLEEAATASWAQLLLCMGTVPRKQKHAAAIPREQCWSVSRNFFKNWYGLALSHPAVKMLVIVWYIVFIGITTFGTLHIKEGLDPRNLLPEDSYLVDYYTSMQEYVWPIGPEVQIVISNPPNFNLPGAVEEANLIVSNFINTSYTMDLEGVTFFLGDFIDYTKKSNKWPFLYDSPTSFGWDLANFLKLGSYGRFRSDVKFGLEEDGEEYVVKAFRFTVGVKHFKTQYSQMQACKTIREIGYSLPQYNISTLWPLWGYMDQYMMVIPNALQNILIALVAMVVVSMLLIPHLLNAVCVAFCIASIAYGCIGFMVLWNVTFDAIAMITMAMSVGFSVDFAAHISHKYVTSKEKTPNAKMCDALGELAWPILQGALSTVFGVLALSTVEAPVIVVFYKMVTMVITIGTAHALVFLPVLLSLLVRDDWGDLLGFTRKQIHD